MVIELFPFRIQHCLEPVYHAFVRPLPLFNFKGPRFGGSLWENNCDDLLAIKWNVKVNFETLRLSVEATVLIPSSIDLKNPILIF